VTLFDRYIIVDWSSAGVPKAGADSIWIAVSDEGGVTLTNPATRAEAERELRAALNVPRVFLGFDFAFGYPEGAAMALTGGDWQAMWAHIEALIEDGADNANNRFDAAAQLNAATDGDGPFWGNGLKRDIEGLPRKKSQGYGTRFPASKRLVETLASGTQETWKLSGVGSVGGQALTGIAMLERMRRDLPLAIWPFEKTSKEKPHLAVEVFPSLIPPHGGEEIKDAGQVRSMVEAVARLDHTGKLAEVLAEPNAQPAQVKREEGWIFGAGNPKTLRPSKPALRYERDPARIYAQSFATVRGEARLERFPEVMQPLVTRLIHACGMTEIADRLAFSPDAVTKGRAALLSGAPVLCDCEMVRAGISTTLMPAQTDLICTLNDSNVPDMAKDLETTRSAAAVHLWRDHIDGAIVSIGNAPTALFQLLELLDNGWPKPSVILGFPVGFVGAAESKAELAANSRGCDFITLRGRKGGSAMASAGVNALAAGLGEATS
jgi:precorrin-8X/cobalt-precorrin-8 methylmutase